MTLPQDQYLALRKHAAALANKLSIRSDADFQPHKLDWKNLAGSQAEIARAARGVADKFQDGAPSDELRTLEAAHDALMALHDDISREMDIRSKIGDRGTRASGDDPFSRRPVHDDAEARGVEGSYEDDVTEAAPPAYSLRHGQSMSEHIRTNRYAGGELRGLTEGAFLRSMVTGANSDIERRALAEGSDSAGGYTVPKVLAARLIDRLRAASVVFRAGAQTLPLSADNLSIAKVASDPVPAWRSENGLIPESDPTFAAVNLVPRSLAVIVRVSRELLEDSLNLETALPNIMAAALAGELDRVALLGTGAAPQPRGVLNFTGKTATTVAAGAVTYGKLIQARTALRSANSDATAFIMHPRDEGTLAGAVDTSGQPINIPAALASVPMLTTTALPLDLGTGNDEAPVFAGDWSKLLIGIRSELRVEVLKERYADSHQYGFVAHLRADIAAEHEACFTTFSVTATD